MLASAALGLAGLLALIAGAELLTRGGVRLAERLGVPPIAIGLTVVALGTSTPELAVGIEAVLTGSPALAVGNIAGTNAVNILLILGLSALIRPLALRLQTLRMDLPAMVAAALALWLLALDGLLSRGDGVVLVALGIAYTAVVLRMARNESRSRRPQPPLPSAATPEGPRTRRETLRSAAALLIGIAVIVQGSEWLVTGAVGLARGWGVSDAFIGLTVVAIGTSSPELVTTLVSTFRGQRDIAIGNLLGSSVYNIAFILGATVLIPASGVPVEAALLRVDLPVMALAALACTPAFLSGGRVSRAEGAAFVAAYLAYLAYLVVART